MITKSGKIGYQGTVKNSPKNSIYVTVDFSLISHHTILRGILCSHYTLGVR